MANDEKEGNEMNALQELKTTQVMDLLKATISQDAEIKAAILNDSNAVVKILQSNIIDELKQELKAQKLILRYDYQNEKQLFLNTCKSENTKSGYNYALQDFEKFCFNCGLQSPIAATPANVDTWLLNQRTDNKAPATIPAATLVTADAAAPATSKEADATSEAICPKSPEVSWLDGVCN